MTFTRSSVLAAAAALAVLSGACSPSVQQGPVKVGDAPARYMPGLGPCSDEPGAALHLDPSQPVVLLVHGCRASAGMFRNLAQVFAAHGQQTACFTYDDRDSLDYSSSQLRQSLETLAGSLHVKELTVLGHSQGGLVARRTLIRERPGGALQAEGLSLRLVTVSSPFQGIAASKHCGWLPLHVATFGVSAGICQLAAGSKWMEIHPSSWFVLQPGTLVDQVSGFLKVVTDERDTCLQRREDGRCAQSDYVFSVGEQNNELVDADPRVTSEVVPEGHSAIVGQHGLPPYRLIEVLQSQGVMARTPADKRAAMQRLLASLY
jgi:pimeloyl-ACP methyl ester carboxylesterase